MRLGIGNHNMFLYDKREIFQIYSSEGKEKIFFGNFLNDKEINLKEISDNYIKMDFDKKYFVLVKIIEKDSRYDFEHFLKNKIFVEQYKYLYEVLFDIKEKNGQKNYEKIIMFYIY